MTAPGPAAGDTPLYEQLAAIQHTIWSHWMRYLLESKTFPITTEPTGRGIRVADVEHWRRQIDTPYAELSEREKASDREQVDRFWPLLALPSGAETGDDEDEPEDGPAFFAAALAEHGRCTCTPNDPCEPGESRCALCNVLPKYWPCPTPTHVGYAAPAIPADGDNLEWRDRMERLAAKWDCEVTTYPPNVREAVYAATAIAMCAAELRAAYRLAPVTEGGPAADDGGVTGAAVDGDMRAFADQWAEAARRACTAYLDGLAAYGVLRRAQEYDRLTDAGQTVWRVVVRKAIEHAPEQLIRDVRFIADDAPPTPEQVAAAARPVSLDEAQSYRTEPAAENILRNEGDDPDREELGWAIRLALRELHPPAVPADRGDGCPTPCDDDCTTDCHEAHEVPEKRVHDVESCAARPASPGAPADTTTETED